MLNSTFSPSFNFDIGAGSGIDFGSWDTGALGTEDVFGDGSFQLGNSTLGLGSIDFGDMTTGFLGADTVLGANNMFSPTDTGATGGINIDELSSIGGLDTFGEVLGLDSMDFDGLIPDWLTSMQDLQGSDWDSLGGPTSLFATNGLEGKDIPDADIKSFVQNQSDAGRPATETLAAMKNYGVYPDRIEQIYELDDGFFSSAAKDFLQDNANVWGNTDLETGQYYGAGTGYFDVEGKFVTWEGKPYTGLNYKDGGTHEYIDGYYSNTDNNLFSSFINDSKEYVLPVAVIESFYDMVRTNKDLNVNSVGDIFQDSDVLAAFINTAIGSIGGAGALANPIASSLTGQSIGKWLGDAFHTDGKSFTIAKLTEHANNMSPMDLARSMARLLDGAARAAGEASPIRIPLPQNAQGNAMALPLSFDFTLRAGEWFVDWVTEQLDKGNDPFKDVLDSRLTPDQIADFVKDNQATKTSQSLEDWASDNNIKTVSDVGAQVADSGYNWLPDVQVTLDPNKRDNNPNYDASGNPVANFSNYPYVGGTGSPRLDYGDGPKPWELDGFDWWRIGADGTQIPDTKKQAMIRSDALAAGFEPPPYPIDHRLQNFKGQYGDIISPSAWDDLFTLPSGGDSVSVGEWEWPEFSMGGVSAGDALDLLKNAFSQTPTMTPEETTSLGKVLQFSDGMRGPDESIMSIEQERQLMEDSPSYDSWLSDKNGGLNQSLLDLNAWNDSMVQKNASMDNWIGASGTGHDWFTRAANVSGKDEALGLLTEAAEAGWDKTFASFGDIDDAPDMTGATNVNRLLGFLDLESYQPLEQAQQFNQEKYDKIMNEYSTTKETLNEVISKSYQDVIDPYNETMLRWGSDTGQGGMFYNEAASITDPDDSRIEQLLEDTKGWEELYTNFNDSFESDFNKLWKQDAADNNWGINDAAMLDRMGANLDLYDTSGYEDQLKKMRSSRRHLNNLLGERVHGYKGYYEGFGGDPDGPFIGSDEASQYERGLENSQGSTQEFTGAYNQSLNDWGDQVDSYHARVMKITDIDDPSIDGLIAEWQQAYDHTKSYKDFETKPAHDFNYDKYNNLTSKMREARAKLEDLKNGEYREQWGNGNYTIKPEHHENKIFGHEWYHD